MWKLQTYTSRLKLKPSFINITTRFYELDNYHLSGLLKNGNCLLFICSPLVDWIQVIGLFSFSSFHDFIDSSTPRDFIQYTGWLFSNKAYYLSKNNNNNYHFWFMLCNWLFSFPIWFTNLISFLTRLIEFFSFLTRIISLELYLRNLGFNIVLQIAWLIKFLMEFFQWSNVESS